MIEIVLVAVEDSHHAFDVMSAARAWAMMLGADTYVLRVVDPRATMRAGLSHTGDELAATAHRAGLRLAGPPLVVEGIPCEVILRTANELGADAVIIGASSLGTPRDGADLAATLKQRGPLSVFVVRAIDAS